MQAHTLEHLRTITHMRPRTNTIGAVMRIRNALAFATHSFFQQHGFMYVHSPIITGSDCEGAGEMFQVWPRRSIASHSAASHKAPHRGSVPS